MFQHFSADSGQSVRCGAERKPALPPGGDGHGAAHGELGGAAYECEPRAAVDESEPVARERRRAADPAQGAPPRPGLLFDSVQRCVRLTANRFFAVGATQSEFHRLATGKYPD